MQDKNGRDSSPVARQLTSLHPNEVSFDKELLHTHLIDMYPINEVRNGTYVSTTHNRVTNF